MSHSTFRKRRGVACTSITRLSGRLAELEGRTDQPTTIDLARRMSQTLESLESEFKAHHQALIDIIDGEGDLQKEQDLLDQHDDDMSDLAVRIQQLITGCSTPSYSTVRKLASWKLSHLQTNLSTVSTGIASLSDETADVCLLYQFQEQVGDIKKELGDLRNSILSLDPEEAGELQTSLTALDKGVFDCSLQIKKLPHSSSQPRGSSVTTSQDGKGVRLPKIDVPTFDGNILNWRSFWEQFNVSVHCRSTLSDPEKLVYLRHSLKDGSAKQVIEGLSRSGEYYAEAIEGLKSRYDRPRLIHQTHVLMILEAPAL